MKEITQKIILHIHRCLCLLFLQALLCVFIIYHFIYNSNFAETKQAKQEPTTHLIKKGKQFFNPFSPKCLKSNHFSISHHLSSHVLHLLP